MAKTSGDSKEQLEKITIRLYPEDLEICRKRAARYAIPYQAYLREVLHQALKKDSQVR